jgi:hypothetical protein
MCRYRRGPRRARTAVAYPVDRRNEKMKSVPPESPLPADRATTDAPARRDAPGPRMAGGRGTREGAVPPICSSSSSYSSPGLVRYRRRSSFGRYRAGAGRHGA